MTTVFDFVILVLSAGCMFISLFYSSSKIENGRRKKIITSIKGYVQDVCRLNVTTLVIYLKLCFNLSTTFSSNSMHFCPYHLTSIFVLDLTCYTVLFLVIPKCQR